MSDRRPSKSKSPQRKGSWEQIQTIEDPDSKIALILSERIRGRPGYAMQIVHFDDIGLNKYIPMEPEGAKHPVEWIVKSLVDRANQIIAERRAKEAIKTSG